ncbi:hypothetical protein EVAR_100734_1 [Eumeta japonica]|uniref:Uncharacterized protein n=1 Tax=Eumeta variegata TaxID=151549 RepID=A0A4C1ZWG9_EUMVA|nr:hypothetical protein EVAR_100734_1 [Eumeta japonica]
MEVFERDNIEQGRARSDGDIDQSPRALRQRNLSPIPLCGNRDFTEKVQTEKRPKIEGGKYQVVYPALCDGAARGARPGRRGRLYFHFHLDSGDLSRLPLGRVWNEPTLSFCSVSQRGVRRAGPGTGSYYGEHNRTLTSSTPDDPDRRARANYNKVEPYSSMRKLKSRFDFEVFILLDRWQTNAKDAHLTDLWNHK